MNHRNLIKVLVNLITTFRLIGSLLLVILFTKIKEIFFLIGIVILFLSDFLDGIIARKFQVQTLYGSTMDTIADKVLSIVLMIPILKHLKVIYFILLGEIAIGSLNGIARLKGKHTRSSKTGKIKMWLLAITIILSYFYYFHFLSCKLALISCIMTIVFQLYTIIEYYRYLKQQKPKKQSKFLLKNYKDIGYKLFSTKYYLTQVKIEK